MSRFSPLHPPKAGPGSKLKLTNLAGAALSLCADQLVRQHRELTVLLTDDTPTALQLQHELHYLAHDDYPVLLFPDRETLPYDSFSPHQDIISQRLEALNTLPSLRHGVLILPISTAITRLCPVDFVAGNVLAFKQGQRINIDALRSQLARAGYHTVEQVYEHGEFTVRGSVIDIFPMGADHPLRLDLFDDELESIRPFDIDSQRSEGQIEAISLLPAREFPTNQQGIERFRTNYGAQFGRISNEPESVYQQISKGIMPAGVECYLPLFFEHTATVFDYLPSQVQLLSVGDIQHACERYLTDAHRRYENQRVDPNRPLLPPDALFLRTEELFAAIKPHGRIQLQPQHSEISKEPQANCQAIVDIEANYQLKQPLTSLLTQKQQWPRLLFSVESEGRREALTELLRSTGLKPKRLEHWQQFVASEETLAVIVSPLEHSVHFNEPNFALVCEAQLFGHRIRQRSQRRNRGINNETLIKNLAELKIGQPVVHLKHGVGRYLGLELLDAGGMVAEFLTLEYATGSKLYVPVNALHLISRYGGGDDEHAPLNKLGSEAWDKSRRKAAEKIRDVAAELLEIYAQREAKKGFAFKLDQGEYLRFSAGFPFEETEDQANAIHAVVADMRRPQAMDRLVCGDVGFGKTEVAMRAAFVAVHAGKQVAVLVPTTLLAQQHYENFRDRFADWPIELEVMSRFKTAGEQKKAMSQLAEGKIDIIIGTHKLLQSDIQFPDLGLLIVDEEHRFGVRQKDKIKALRAEVDILTLTATPIPRTLNMAMSGMRDLSIIATPPKRRLAVKTFVRPKEGSLIREALTREILRGGQVYYLHNSVETIEECAQELAELVPEARIGIAHGQMRERQLEQVMSQFHHGRYNLLVCTTIIETGIDIPSANTILIERADKFGLAQLHQLRGRVGRSHHQAYAYLLTPSKRLSKDAQKRLDAIEQLDDLGAGFLLATQDLEIRGAGELLGDEQSGHIAKIGFSMYMDMLEQTVEALKAGQEPSMDALLAEQTELELRLPALLPEEYIPHVNTRLSIYKQLASCKDEQALILAKVELVDRFGRLPSAAENLIETARLKLKASKLGIRRIEANAHSGSIDFAEHTPVQAGSLIKLLQNNPTALKMDGPTKLRFTQPMADAATRFSEIDHWLTQFSADLTG